MRNFRAPLVIVAAIAAAALTGCGQGGTPGGSGADPDPTFSVQPDTPMNDLETVAPSGDTGNDTGGGTDNGGGGTDNGNNGDPNAPRIEYFRVAQQPSCPSGTNLNPIDGTPVTLEWKVVNVDAASISIDGPGLYGTYEPEKSDTFPFSCGGEPGSTQEHTYLLTTVGGDGEAQTKEITVSAKVNEITVVDDKVAVSPAPGA
jgi:hypothetical protein